MRPAVGKAAAFIPGVTKARGTEPTMTRTRAVVSIAGKTTCNRRGGEPETLMAWPAWPGNVAQWTVNYPDPATAGYVYRLEDPVDLEHGVMGGSWAKSESYLRCGDRCTSHRGNRHPGPRFPARANRPGQDWSTHRRKLSADAAGRGQSAVELGAAANGCRLDTAVPRLIAPRRSDAGFRVTKNPIDDVDDLRRCRPQAG